MSAEIAIGHVRRLREHPPRRLVLPEEMARSPLIVEAFHQSRRLHRGQRRVLEGTPFFHHPYRVGLLCWIDSNGDEVTTVIGFLHDLPEKVPQSKYSVQQLGEDFGHQVLHGVLSIADIEGSLDRSLKGRSDTWKSRKQEYLDNLRQAPIRALRTAVADKLDNLLGLIMSHQYIGDDIWQRFGAGSYAQLWYYRSVLEIAVDVGLEEKYDSVLVVLLREAIEEAERKFRDESRE